jgi:hypothetical protein
MYQIRGVRSGAASVSLLELETELSENDTDRSVYCTVYVCYALRFVIKIL